ncbi:MAG: HlyD family secretion protein [Rhodospirillales bacterium]|nr:HlyD family secretion protein [Rhodospirillales bacterium]
MSQAAAAQQSPRVAGDAVPVMARQRRLSILRPLLMVGGVLAVAAVTLVLWVTGGGTVTSDDAYVEADHLAISTDVSGLVSDIAVREGQAVNKGQVLFRLDPRRFEIALAAAKADLNNTALTIESMKQDYRRILSNVASTEATMASDRATVVRDTWLRERGGIPVANYDDARFRLAADRAAIQSLRHSAAVELAKLGGDLSLPLTAVPQYQAAAAKVAEAERRLSHSVVRAPFSGIVTDVSKLQPGMYLKTGTAAFGLVSNRHFWVTANPKETELTWVKPGDQATVRVDTYPGRAWHGVVESISPAVGSEFSLLPAENSSGNWVKVVQRIPLRVRLDLRSGDPPLRAGMSVEVSIKTGHRRTLADLW